MSVLLSRCRLAAAIAAAADVGKAGSGGPILGSGAACGEAVRTPEGTTAEAAVWRGYFLLLPVVTPAGSTAVMQLCGAVPSCFLPAW